MQLKLCFLLGAFTCLAVDAQNTVFAAISEAISEYQTANGRLTELNPDCETDSLGSRPPCGIAFVGPCISPHGQPSHESADGS